MNFIDERINNYILSLKEGYFPKDIMNLRQLCINENIPLVRDDVAYFLDFLIKMRRPAKILEVGAAYGFSSAIMARALESARITTLERDNQRFLKAKHNLLELKTTNVTLIECDALEFMKSDESRYDLIFIDAAKGQYRNFLDLAMKLLNSDGMIVIDNVLIDGHLFDTDNKKFKTIIKRMNEFNRYIHSESFNTTLLPIGDGLALVTLQEINNEQG